MQLNSRLVTQCFAQSRGGSGSYDSLGLLDGLHPVRGSKQGRINLHTSVAVFDAGLAAV